MNWLQKQRKTLVAVGLAALLVVTAYLNHRINQSVTDTGMANNLVMQNTAKPTQAGAVSLSATSDEAVVETVKTNTIAKGDYFDEYRAQRDTTRQKELSQLDAIIDDTRTDADTLTRAQQQKLDLTSAMEYELTMEGLVIAKGIPDAVVTYKKGSVNVVVKNNELSGQQVAQILDIVQRECGEEAGNIKIQPMKSGN